MEHIRVISLRSDTKERAAGRFSVVHERDIERCKQIQREGGLGLAFAVFEFPPPPNAPKKALTTYFIERYDLWDRPDPSHPRLTRLQEVEDIVKSRVNGVPLPGNLDRLAAMIRGAPLKEEPEVLMFTEEQWQEKPAKAP